MSAQRHTCPPCSGQCRQDRECPADPPNTRDLRTLTWIVLASWIGVIGLVRLVCWFLFGESS